MTLLLRPAARDAIQAAGLHIAGHTTFGGPIVCVTEPAQAKGPFDAVFLTAKAHATATLTPLVAPLLKPSGTFATLQNGLGNVEKVKRFVAADRVAVALTSHGVTVEGPGRLRHAGTGITKVGPAPGAAPEAAHAAERLLRDAGLDPEWHDAMRGHVWNKAIVNAGINPVGALYGVPNGEIKDRDDLRGLALGLVRESVALAERARVGLPPGDLAETILAVLERTRENRNSMLQDVLARRPTEVEQITGRMVRLGERLLVSMPRSDSVYGRVKDLESSYLGTERAIRMAWDELPWEEEPF